MTGPIEWWPKESRQARREFDATSPTLGGEACPSFTFHLLRLRRPCPWNHRQLSQAANCTPLTSKLLTISYRAHSCKALLGGGVWGSSSPPPPRRKASPSNVKLSDMSRERVTMIYGGAALARAMSARALSGRLVSGRPVSGRAASSWAAAGGSPKHAPPGSPDRYAPLVLDGAARRPHSAAGPSPLGP